MLSSPIFDHGDDPVRHWKGGDYAGFFTTPVLMSKTLCVPWQLPVGPRNMPGNVQEHMVLVIVGSSWASMYDPTVALQCLSKLSSRPRTILRGEYFLDTPTAAGRLFSQSTAK